MPPPLNLPKKKTHAIATPTIGCTAILGVMITGLSAPDDESLAIAARSMVDLPRQIPTSS